ncbi:methylenetetrahydrofolate reductase [Petrotoga sp. 9PW.55.5.1]|uniref:methylenetetrahydrofolate reductase n=1 Tax=Petrotoga sp. 9PW.55.5.1 TaxID=1308979 RepID=UPI000DC57F8D|nr:methylenetetrahydrofolate reductase [Petrotoga sp. 9PW.55.5.1]RAO99722.1 methylenetetrahydrofolate reductase [Petrotoga sp. 9PW.55.5.1]
MKIIDFICQSEKPILSFEIIPPQVGESIDSIFKAIDNLIEFSPKFINVTKHADEIEYLEENDKIVKIIKKKRPGTVGISASIKHRYNIEVVPHLICTGINKYQLEEILVDLNYLKIDNVLVLRGDKKKYTWREDGEYDHAYQLVKQISDMNKGIYTTPTKEHNPTNFCIGVAGYPEKHFESPNFEKDLEYLKLKVDMGAEFIITQMFFDVEYYLNFVQKVRNFGIEVPIIPGIKPVASKKSLYNIPQNFHVNIPKNMVEDFDNAVTAQDEFSVGVKHTVDLIAKLLELGVPGIHLFTMGKGKIIKAVLKEFREVF